MRPNISEQPVRLRNVRRLAGGARRALTRAASTLGAEPGGRPERDPDARRRLDTLDDWILFGPRMR
jgi:hypothetical protein